MNQRFVPFARRLAIAACLVTVTARTALLQAGTGAVVVTPGTVVVSQFAVPVAVPQYVVPQYAQPVAPPSYVQYGNIPRSTHSGAATDALEERIAERVVRALRAGGVSATAATAPASLVGRTCGNCHGDAQARGNLNLARPGELSAERRLQAIARVLSDDPQRRMPPPASDMRLAPEELGLLLQELSQTRKEGE